MRRILGAALAGLLTTGGVHAADGTLEPAATLHRAHLAYLSNTERPHKALIQARSRPSLSQKLDGVVLARAAAEYGLLAEAERRYSQADRGRDARYSEAWLSLAQAWYRRGRYARALEAVRHVAGHMTEKVAKSAGPLEARILLAQDKPEKAVAVLRKSLSRYDQPLLTRFNLGVALTRAGDNQAGAGELNAIGTTEADESETRALRDKANLALAYAYLELAQGGTARSLFDRIRLDGPYANRALLGLGWAELAPDGQTQTLATVRPIPCREDPARLLPDSLPVLHRPAREACGEPEMFRDREDLATRPSAETEAARYRKALVPWTELATRSVSNPAVQEALVGVAFAYRELAATEQARTAFEQATDRLEAQHDTIRTVLDRLTQPPAHTGFRSDGTLGPQWAARRWDLPAGDHAAYLMPAVTDNGFRLTARSLRDLAALTQANASAVTSTQTLTDRVEAFVNSITGSDGSVPDTLRAQQDKLAALPSRLASLRERLEQQRAAHDRRLRQRTRAGVLAYKRQLENYIQQARRGRAGLYAGEPDQGESRP